MKLAKSGSGINLESSCFSQMDILAQVFNGKVVLNLSNNELNGSPISGRNYIARIGLAIAVLIDIKLGNVWTAMRPSSAVRVTGVLGVVVFAIGATVRVTVGTTGSVTGIVASMGVVTTVAVGMSESGSESGGYYCCHGNHWEHGGG